MAGRGVECDWRPIVEHNRATIVLKIKQRLDKYVAREGEDDAARETKLGHIATRFEETQWRDASSVSDYTDRIKTKIMELRNKVVSAPTVRTIRPSLPPLHPPSPHPPDGPLVRGHPRP